MSEVEQYAGAVSRVVHRLRTAVQRRVARENEHFLHEWELTDAAATILGSLRNTVPDRLAPWTNVAASFVYEPPSTVMRGVDDLTERGLIETSGIGALLTTRGREAVAALFRVNGKITDELWGDSTATCDEVLPLLDTVARAGAETGGEAFGLIYPVYEPEDASSTLKVAGLLTALHFHRFDAHVGAWKSAGLSAQEAHLLTGGALWRVLQDETNARDAAPYSAIPRKQRVELLAGLGSLPG